MPDGTIVRLFFDGGTTYTGHTFEQTHSEELHVSGGEAQLGSDPFKTGRSAGMGTGGHHLLLIEVAGHGEDEFCFQEPTDFNIAYWSGYRDRRHPAVYTLRLGNREYNGCNLKLPPERVNEPFATSPYNSQLRFDPAPGKGGKEFRVLTIRLLDDARPANVMRGRQIRITGERGKTLGAGVTDARGTLRVTMPRQTKSVKVVDLTDNHLLITGSD
jgi:hypothetical protein